MNHPKMMDVRFFEFSKKFSSIYEKMCEGVCAENDINQTCFDIVSFLYNNPGYNTAKDISKYRDLKSNVVSMNVDKLVKAGFIDRLEVPEDRRIVKLILTKKASVLTSKHEEICQNMFSVLSQGMTVEEVFTFKNLFDKIMQNAENAYNK